MRTGLKVVYTAVFGDYDRVPPVNPEWDCDFVCFTDNPDIVSDGWRVEIVQRNGESAAQGNRRYKMLPHKYLSHYERSLYVDGNICIVADPTPLFHKYLDHGVIAIPRHQDRNCAYKEARICIEGGRVNKDITESQMARYERLGFPKGFGMTENGIIFRKHLDLDVINLMESWWEEYCRGGRRDQLSLPYLIWKTRINVGEVTESVRTTKQFFEINLHAADNSKSLIRRWARQVNARKHLAGHYMLAAKLLDLLVAARDKWRNGKSIMTADRDPPIN